MGKGNPHMMEIFAGFDILGLGTLLGSVLFLAGLLRVLLDNRSFDEVNRRHAAAAEPEALASARGASWVGDRGKPRTGTDDGTSGRPSRPGRAA